MFIVEVPENVRETFLRTLLKTLFREHSSKKLLPSDPICLFDSYLPSTIESHKSISFPLYPPFLFPFFFVLILTYYSPLLSPFIILPLPSSLYSPSFSLILPYYPPPLLPVIVFTTYSLLLLIFSSLFDFLLSLLYVRSPIASFRLFL